MAKHPVYLKVFDGHDEHFTDVPEELGGYENVVDAMERAIKKAYELGRRHQIEIMSVLLTEQIDVIRKGEDFNRDDHKAVSSPAVPLHGVL